MRILFAIAHFFSADGKSGGAKGHASVGGREQKRVRALTACITTLRQHFGGQYFIDIHERRLKPANQAEAMSADVVVCTTRGAHLLDRLGLPEGHFTHMPTEADPPFLGYECHKALAYHLGEYDYYCYLEDDLVLHDPLFFSKLAWFASLAGEQCALQPNRFERSSGPYRKVYIDGDIRPGATEPFQDVNESPFIRTGFLDREITFIRPHNPHSGCFFLSAGQMLRLSEQHYFARPDSAFIGPLESAASLHLMRAFRVYKPAMENAAFLEIEHFEPNFISLIGGQVAPPEP